MRLLLLTAIVADGDSYVQKYSGRSVSTLFKFNEAVSPHVAARGADLIVRSLCWVCWLLLLIGLA